MATNGNSEHDSSTDSSTDSKRDIGLGSSGDTDILELRERLESLPQELYNHIYDLTFTANPRIRIYGISRWARFYLTSSVLPNTISGRVVAFDERLPNMFRVDRASRRKFAKSYFSGEDSTFIFCVGYCTRDCLEGMSYHRLLIKNVLWSCEPTQPVPSTQASKLAKHYHSWWLEKSPKTFKFITYDEIEALVKKRAGIADEGDKGDGADCGKDAMSAKDIHCASLILRQHLNKLPQELYDKIYDLIFTAAARIRVYTKNKSWLANLRRPAPGVFSDRDATFHEEFPPGFPRPPKDVSKQDTTLNKQLPPILQADRADRNAFSLTFFGERD
ncbi:hypothetical protein CBER1_10120 [Cercospora berteroae]|uniref:Uncharacterized protein n=1 Tax=Cercospora berteroae TaxID=357750 RepID=A0A2S6CKH1_9PEZI|nr:hypothetical protein CBER1_10120 [Cercospora berteroae]